MNKILNKEILNRKILDDIREWIAIDKDNSVRIVNTKKSDSLKYNHDDIMPYINILDNYDTVEFSTKRCIYYLCSMHISDHNINHIYILPTNYSQHNLRIMINTNGSVIIHPNVDCLKDDTLANCYTMQSIYSYIKDNYLKNNELAKKYWSVPKYFENIPKFTSFQYLLDQFNQPITEDIVIEI